MTPFKILLAMVTVVLLIAVDNMLETMPDRGAMRTLVWLTIIANATALRWGVVNYAKNSK